ncbi:LIM [Musa troglodytarum]|uniref:LIM n=1 Tax=Musa troglodytarum TaxID=320322 RepID=A0A9E7G1Q5_9LILI|nr:LIM [Musa troglodytarum]
MSFSGTQDKCKACEKTVHFIDLLTADGVTYHKTCFKCSHCKGTLSMCNYSSMDGVLYCKPHFEQLFKETGTFTKNVMYRIIRFSVLMLGSYMISGTKSGERNEQVRQFDHARFKP